jgi:hypothetical protein
LASGVEKALCSTERVGRIRRTGGELSTIHAGKIA